MNERNKFSIFRSRLGCQITIDESMDGITVKVPAEVADART